MSIELWGFQGSAYLDFPSRSAGYILFAVALPAVLFLYASSRDEGVKDFREKPAWTWPLTLALALAAPLMSQTFLIRFQVPGTLNAADSALNMQEASLAIFGALPWMIAGGLLGVRQALLIGFLGGLARGAWGTHSIFTPVYFTLQAGLVAWLLRREYIELPGRLARSPLLSGLIGGLLFGTTQVIERFAFSGGSTLDGLDFTLALLAPTILVAVIEAGFAGAVGEGVRWFARDVWFQPRHFVTGPYNRSLAARLLTIFTLLGIFSGSILLTGGWLSIQSSARDLIEEQMRQTARQASESIPFFVQMGRSFSRQMANEMALHLRDESLTEEVLESRVKSISFFDQLAIYNHNSKLLDMYPSEPEPIHSGTLEFEAYLSAALEGVPGEVIRNPTSENESTSMAFLSSIRATNSERIIGVFVGWTDLTSNIFLAPLIAGFREFTHGSAYLTDAGGEVLIYPVVEGYIQDLALENLQDGLIEVITTADGTRQLVYSLSVGGYPWHVIVTVPLREVQRQAFDISTRLVMVLALVGVVMVVAIYIVSRRVTQPLRFMADMAQTIARGNLIQPVPDVGEDEIGQLAASFEKMRRGLKARLDEMGLLLEVSRQVSTSFELSKILPSILEGVKDIAEADLVRLVLSSSGDDSKRIYEGGQAGEDPGNWASLDAQILRLCEERGRFTIENPTRAKAILDLREVVETIEVLSALPMLHEGDFVGVLWLGHKTPHAFSSDEINLLSILAGQLGAAIANSHLYQRAEQERLRLMAVLDGTPDAVIVIDPEGRVLLINPALAALLNVRAEDAVGQSIEDVVTFPVLAKLLLEKDYDALTEEIELSHGQVMFASVSDIQTEDGNVLGRVCVLWDISHYKRLDALKTEFVSTVSHDLRAPLTLMRGYATMLGMVGDVNDQQREFIGKILSSVDQMGNLVDNLLDLGRIEAGMGLSITSIPIESIVHEVLGAFRPQAVNKQITLHVELGEGMEPILADPTLVRQALANLLDNAIKYTPAGGEVKVEVEQDDTIQRIRVTDTGVGIAPTDQARLFEKFYRAQRGENLRQKGLGLGLAIVKSIVEQHGGRVTVESRLGRGSTFIIEMPIHPPVAESTT
jgi:PAS domain S-box-containing protein